MTMSGVSVEEAMAAAEQLVQQELIENYTTEKGAPACRLTPKGRKLADAMRV